MEYWGSGVQRSSMEDILVARMGVTCIDQLRNQTKLAANVCSQAVKNTEKTYLVIVMTPSKQRCWVAIVITGTKINKMTPVNIITTSRIMTTMKQKILALTSNL